MTAQTPSAATRRRRGRLAAVGRLRWLPAVTLVAVLTITASAEFELARTVLDLPPHIAWALPVAIDSYVLAALRSGRDVLPALSVMAGALAASMGAHLSADPASGRPLPGHVVAPAATAIMIVLVVVAWRVHVLIEHTATEPTQAPPAEESSTPVPDPGTSTDTAGTSTSTSTPSLNGSGTSPAIGSGTPAALGSGTGRPPGSLDQGRSRAPGRPAPAVSSSTRPAPGDPYGVRERTAAASDAEILAAIRGTTPSIRALRSTYSIGSARASRLWEQNNVSSQNSQPENAETTDRETSKESTTSHTDDNAKNQREESNKNANQKTKSNTHTCITDRVGPAPAPGEASGSAVEADSRAVLHSVRGA